MKCSKCGYKLGQDRLSAYKQVFQVRVGYVEDDEVTFSPEEDVGYYCSECLKDGV